jgi:hypothetical protein
MRWKSASRRDVIDQWIRNTGILRSILLLREATHVTSYRKAYFWEGKPSSKPERVWRIRPEGLAGNRASDKSAVASFVACRFTLKFTSRNMCG